MSALTKEQEEFVSRIEKNGVGHDIDLYEVIGTFRDMVRELSARCETMEANRKIDFRDRMEIGAETTALRAELKAEKERCARLEDGLRRGCSCRPGGSTCLCCRALAAREGGE